jgi:hypothetical protein
MHVIINARMKYKFRLPPSILLERRCLGGVSSGGSSGWRRAWGEVGWSEVSGQSITFSTGNGTMQISLHFGHAISVPALRVAICILTPHFGQANRMGMSCSPLESAVNGIFGQLPASRPRIGLLGLALLMWLLLWRGASSCQGERLDGIILVVATGSSYPVKVGAGATGCDSSSCPLAPTRRKEESSMVRCADCGFLARRKNEMRELVEAEQVTRDMGSPGGSMDKVLVCARSVQRIDEECTKASPGGLVQSQFVLEVIQRDRGECPGFFPWRPGWSPK